MIIRRKGARIGTISDLKRQQPFDILASDFLLLASNGNKILVARQITV
jgi:hypothetical protein